MNTELVDALLKRFEKSTESIDNIVTRFDGLFTVLDKLDVVSGKIVHESRLEEIKKIALSVDSLNSNCEETIGNIAAKSKELDSYVGNLDQYAVTHVNDLKKSVQAFAELSKLITVFNREVRPDVEGLVGQVNELANLKEDLQSMSTLINNLKEKIGSDSENLRKTMLALDLNVLENGGEIVRLNEKIEELLAANISFNQMYQKLQSDGETYKKFIAGMIKEWSEENLSKSAYKGSEDKSLMSKLFGNK